MVFMARLFRATVWWTLMQQPENGRVEATIGLREREERR